MIPLNAVSVSVQADTATCHDSSSIQATFCASTQADAILNAVSTSQSLASHRFVDILLISSQSLSRSISLLTVATLDNHSSNALAD